MERFISAWDRAAWSPPGDLKMEVGIPMKNTFTSRFSKSRLEAEALSQAGTAAATSRFIGTPMRSKMRPTPSSGN